MAAVEAWCDCAIGLCVNCHERLHMDQLEEYQHIASKTNSEVYQVTRSSAEGAGDHNLSRV